MCKKSLLAILVILLVTIFAGCEDDTDNNSQTDETCGNQKLDTDEECDGNLLRAKDCNALDSNMKGPLTCDNTCHYVKTACENKSPNQRPTPICGDGSVNQTSEQCDKKDLHGATCESLDNTKTGTLSCNSSCQFDTSQCVDKVAGCTEVTDFTGSYTSSQLTNTPSTTDAGLSQITPMLTNIDSSNGWKKKGKYGVVKHLSSPISIIGATVTAVTKNGVFYVEDTSGSYFIYDTSISTTIAPGDIVNFDIDEIMLYKGKLGNSYTTTGSNGILEFSKISNLTVTAHDSQIYHTEYSDTESYNIGTLVRAWGTLSSKNNCGKGYLCYTMEHDNISVTVRIADTDTSLEEDKCITFFGPYDTYKTATQLNLNSDNYTIKN